MRRVDKKDKTLVGFREQDPRFVADLSECHTVIPEIGGRITALAALVDGLHARADIPQIEFIAGDATAEFSGIALVFRHLKPLGDADRAALVAFGQQHSFAIFLQPGGVDSVHPLWPEAPALAFVLPQWNVELAFRPLDFIQVNAGLNGKMIQHALDLLDPQPEDRVLDLFAGLGTFALALDGDVTTAEASRDSVLALQSAARRSDRRIAAEHRDLYRRPLDAKELAAFDAVVLDPPRAGAEEQVEQLAGSSVPRIAYVSCNPATFARDAAILASGGYRLDWVRPVGQFRWSTHIELAARFSR